MQTEERKRLITHKVKCPSCGKTFIYWSDELWSYKFIHHHRKYRCCSYNCMITQLRKVADQDRNIIAKATHKKQPGMAIVRELIGIDASEAHTLGEWAELFDLDYYKFWSLKEEMHLCVEDALTMMLMEKGAV